jgi:Fe-S oxidoreductase
MCPSYMATREEAHSTRGRANTLRLAMAGRLGESGLGDDGVFEVLDLCLECRACKAECPVGVDVARFKSEFLADYWRRHGTPIGARLIGHVHTLAAVGSRLAPVSNIVARSAVGRWLGERIAGVDRRRSLPAWTRHTFARRLAHRGPASSLQPRASTVVLFNDTFTNYMTPEIGLAAVDVLGAAGISVRLAPHRCCGRPLISQGLLDDARKLAAANAEALYDAASRGERIVFLEPSCLSAVREDAPALLRGDAQQKARAVGNACFLFEDVLERERQADAVQLLLRSGPSRVLLHGHCHQKAMGLLPPARALLSRIPSCTTIDLDAGCCGMAGSFGYARKHYEVSRQIGERRLLPAAREMGAGTVLVASGVSCRQQVAHFTGVRALHPAELLKSLLMT